MNAATANTTRGTRRTKDPFAALPHHIAGDPRVSPLGKAVLLALLFWARGKDHCWPADASIGRRVGRSPATVQRALRHLQDLGLIDRQKTDANRTGRVIRLLWRAGTGEGPPRSVVIAPPLAGVRDEGDVVIVQGDAPKEIRGLPPERSRPEPSASTAVPVSRPQPAGVLNPALGSIPVPINQEARPGATTLVGGAAPTRAPATAATGLAPACHPAEAEHPMVSPSGPIMWPARLARSAARAHPSAASPRATPDDKGVAESRVLVGLTPSEQARLRELPAATREQVLRWVALGDAICLGEARRLLAPPGPAEPPPQSLATPELLAGLPGRPDRIGAAAGRLAMELGDASSYGYYQAVAESVCRRRHPAAALVGAWRQGTNPRSSRPGAVFATAWKRATQSQP